MLTTPDGTPLTVGVPITDRWVDARVWRMNVGRCPVLLLDANVPGNAREDRELTAKLYQGDSDVRIRQEILLGVGGMRALRAAGMRPTVLHLNEGHSAFALIERLRELREGTDLSFEAALEAVRGRVGFYDAYAGSRRSRRVSSGPSGPSPGHVPGRVRHRVGPCYGDRPVSGWQSVVSLLYDDPGAARGRVAQRRIAAARRGHTPDVADALAQRSVV